LTIICMTLIIPQSIYIEADLYELFNKLLTKPSLLPYFHTSLCSSLT